MIKQALYHQGISTKYLGPTDTKGSRVKASATGGRSVTLPWDYALGIEGNHTAAASALVAKLGWGGQWIGAGGDEGGFAFASVPKDGALAFDAGEATH